MRWDPRIMGVRIELEVGHQLCYSCGDTEILLESLSNVPEDVFEFSKCFQMFPNVSEDVS